MFKKMSTSLIENSICIKVCFAFENCYYLNLGLRGKDDLRKRVLPLEKVSEALP